MDYHAILQDCLSATLRQCVPGAAPKDLQSAAVLFMGETHKGARSRKIIAEALVIQEAELDLLRAELARVAQVDIEEGGLTSEIIRRNHLLTVLRALSWFETGVAQGSKLALYQLERSASSHLDVFKSLRALELLMRDLLREQHPDAEGLEARLRQLFPSSYRDAIRRGQGDPLSGVYLKELIAFFVDPLEWQQVGRLFQPSKFLSLLRDKRATAESFLEDVRRVRNSVAHLKTLSVIQIELLNLYYEELVAPVREAFKQGSTRVDPARYEVASNEAVQDYLEKVAAEISSNSRRTLRLAIAALVAVVALLLLSIPAVLPKFRLWVDPDLAYEDAYRREPQALGALGLQACENGRLGALAKLSQKPEASGAFSGPESIALHAGVISVAARSPQILAPCVAALHSMGWDVNRPSSAEAIDLFGSATTTSVAGYRSFLVFYAEGMASTIHTDPAHVRVTPLQCAVWNESNDLARALVAAGADPSATSMIDGIWLGSRGPQPAISIRSEAKRIGNTAILETLH
jgi:hypothetical protein